MIPHRIGLIIIPLVLIALAIVFLRTEQGHCVARTLAVESEYLNQRRELWTLQVEVARLRAPQSVHDRLKWFQADLAPPAGAPLVLFQGRLAAGFRANVED